MSRQPLVRMALPLVAAALFVFALVTVLTQPERTQAAPALATPATPFASTVAGVGVIEPRGEEIAIGTHVPGIVAAVEVQAGQRVEPGTALFRIDDRQARADLALAEARVRSAEVALADARDQYERAARSYERRAVSEAEATRRRFATELAQTQLAEARAQVRRLATELERLVVQSPVAATVLRVNLRAGEFAPAGVLAEPLVVLGDDTLLHVRVEIDQSDAHRVRPGARAVGTLRGDGGRQAPLAFVRFEPLVRPKRSLIGDGTERVDTRVLEALYALDPAALGAFVGQQMDVFVEAAPLGMEGAGPDGGAPRGEGS